MIQRIQTIFLLLVVFCAFILWVFPFVHYAETAPLYLRNPVDIAPIPNYLSAFLGLIAIFLYGNRKIQIKLCHVIMLLNLIQFLLLFFFSNQLYDHDFEKAKLIWPAYLPLLAAAAAFLASRYIKKDEELVRSADRIR